jgi:hypothetical protein
MLQPLSFFYQSVLLKRPLLSALCLLLLMVLVGIKIPDVSVDASADSLVLEGDKALDVYRDVIKRYGSEEFVLLTYTPADGDILSEFSLSQLAALKKDLSALPGVSGVVTILDVPLLYSPPVTISTLGSGIRYLTEADIDKKLVAQELLNSPIYHDLLSSRDGKTTALQVNIRRDEHYHRLLKARDQWRLLDKEQRLDAEQKAELARAESEFKQYVLIANENQKQLVAGVRSVLPAYREHATIYVGGVPMIAADMIRFVQSDLMIFGSGILVFIVVLLSVFFRQLRWVVLPLVTCMATAAGMLGLLGWLDWRMTVISSNFLALLLILTLSVTIHLVVRYRELHAQNPAWSSRQLATQSMVLMAKPCLFTTLTTIVAFMSLVVSGIRPVIDFGWMMTIGCALALVMAFIVLPLGLVLMRVTPAQSDNSDNATFTSHFANVTERFGGTILVVSGLLLCLSVYGISQLKVENRFIDYFHESTEIYQGMEMIDRNLGGTIPLDIVVRTKAESGVQPQSTGKQPENKMEETTLGGTEPTAQDDGFFEDDFFSEPQKDDFAGGEDSGSYWFTRAGLNEAEKLHDFIDSLDETGKTLSLATLYKLTRDITGGGVDDIQLALMKKNVTEPIQTTLLDPYLDEEADEMRLTVRVMETSRSLQRGALLQQVDDFLQNEMHYQPEQYDLTGMLVLYNNMLQSLYRSQIATLGAVFLAITLMFTILFRSFYIALIAIAPNLLAAGMVLGSMGLVGIPLDMMTITIAAITVGIGVDDTIHYIHRFRSEFELDGDYLAAMHRSHCSIGKAMYYTSVTIVCGFSILALSNFTPSIYFGLLTGFAMFSALLGALLLLPKLLITLKPLGPSRV